MVSVTAGVRRPATQQAVVREAPRWPALWAAGWIGGFCLIVLGAAGYNQLIRGVPLDDGGRVALFATVLRLATVVVALASVQAWGRIMPGWLPLAALCGAAATQLLYPLAETAIKLAILVGVVEPFGKGISNMSAVGWFNFGAAWLVWGVPGVLFGLAARSFKRRHRLSLLGPLLGLVGGGVALVLLGWLIG